MERVYTIPLRTVKTAPSSKRTMKAVRFVKRFIEKNMKSEQVKIDGKLNEKLWKNGIRNIPSKIKVKATALDDGSVLVTPAE